VKDVNNFDITFRLRFYSIGNSIFKKIVLFVINIVK